MEGEKDREGGMEGEEEEWRRNGGRGGGMDGEKEGRNLGREGGMDGEKKVGREGEIEGAKEEWREREGGSCRASLPRPPTQPSTQRRDAVHLVVAGGYRGSKEQQIVREREGERETHTCETTDREKHSQREEEERGAL
ncbi:hypothetical protein C0Q70_06908 [Pomacea canaliculata]|uniref:Uncharacterized protein n=1 Tax=Pomacea canaliculata TaxID=400727 RepID=A0A2T7PDK3_POMCA|nr:hypothetical protein C0Q70_06908 [Pomacea canaliculata]